MPPVPRLRVVPLDLIRRHEEIDPMRVERLATRISSDGIQVNPMVCTEAPDGTLVLFDGATRTEAMRRLGLGHAVVQIVEPDQVELETWHHVVTGCRPEEVVAQIDDRPELEMITVGEAPRIHLVDGGYSSVVGRGLSPNATLSALVHTYIGRWTVARVIDPDIESVAWRYPEWSVVIEFPRLSVHDVVKAAVGDDLLPAGITRFLVDDRALRLNIETSVLGSAHLTTEEKQDLLEKLLAERAHAGRIRRYEEPVYILDD